MKFTDSKIKGIKTPKKREYVWEGGTGFGIRLEPTGTKTFVLWYRFNGKPEGITIGRYPKIGLAMARTKSAKIKERLETGIDPRIDIKSEKRANKEAYTVNDLVEEYIEKHAKLKKRSWKEDERILFKDVVPNWGRRKAKDINRLHINLLLDSIVERGAPIQANMTLAVIRKMFNFAIGRSILAFNPCLGIPRPSKPKQRSRILSEHEIKEFWIGLDNARMAEGTKLALKLQLVTAQRKGEVAGAEWRDFDFQKGWWTIPAEKTKNGLSHRIPLSSLALEIIKDAKEYSGDSKWVFPSPHKDKHITEPAIDHAVRNNHDNFGIDHFTPHDLRRTAASLMTGAGISRLTVGKILNHAESGVTATYDRHSYDLEKRQALETWERNLKSIITGKKAKVIGLK
jgi:integrase